MISVALFVAMAYAAIALLDTSWHFLWMLAYVCRKAYVEGQRGLHIKQRWQ